ncbi:MAG: protein kinase [Gemmataceae bacterium]|nr:protein kinase [Gemmataceae bacterium]
MAAPASADEFLDLVKKSGVVDEKRLDAYAQQLRASGGFPDEPGKFAGLMVRDGLLTHFQAEQFLLGKWRRFTIGKYKVLERLGSGGMGSVYLCEHKFMRRRVAVKVLPAAKAEDPASLERFYREARAAAALDHPNIVRAYDIDQDENLHFLVMEYVDGASLQEIIKKTGPMHVLRACHYVRQAAIGMQHAHEAGLVHRDIKPGNLLVDRTGTMKVLDMGLARFFHDEEDILTKKYDESVLGTADYLAPEQALDSHGVDIRADIYSLGATFYFCLTGQPPFNEGTVAQKLIWHQTRQPKPIRTIRPEVPEQVAVVIAKMMEKDKLKRYQTPAQVAEALAPLTTRPIPPPPEAEMPRLSPAAMMPVTTEASINISPPTPMVQRPAQAPAATPAPRPQQQIAAAMQAAPRPPQQSAQPTPDPRRVATPPPRPQSGHRPPAPAASNGTFAPPHASRGDEPAPNWGDMAAGRPAGVPRSSVSRAPARPRGKQLVDAVKKRPAFWAIVAGGALLIFIAMVVVLAMVFTSGKPKTNRAQDGGKKIVVSRDPAKGEVRTLRQAIEKAGPGDRIVLADEFIEELPLELGPSALKPPKDLTIEGDKSLGKPVVWRPPPSLLSGQRASQFISLSHCDGLTLRGLHIFAQHGSNQFPDAVTIFGRCPGLKLEDVRIQGFVSAGIRLINCAGESGRPLTLQRVAVLQPARPDAVGIAVDVFRRFSSTVASLEHVRVDDCRFDGPIRAGVHLTVEAGCEIGNLDVQRSRFFRANDAFLYRKQPQKTVVRMNVESNTICESAFGLHLEGLPDDKSQIAMKNNLFIKTRTVAQLDDDPTLSIVRQPKESPAQWIWLNEGDPAKDAPRGNAYFRKTFNVPKDFANATLEVLCDDKCSVWINGGTWTSGDLPLGGRMHSFNVTPHLRPEQTNSIAVVGWNEAGPAGLLLQLSGTVGPNPARQIILASDGSWKCTKENPPLGWHELQFKEDDKWQPVKAFAAFNAFPGRSPVWDSVVRENLGKLVEKTVPPDLGNCRDAGSLEGTIFIRARIVDVASVIYDEKSETQFLRYAKNSPLAQEGPDKKPVGAPPVD